MSRTTLEIADNFGIFCMLWTLASVLAIPAALWANVISPFSAAAAAATSITILIFIVLGCIGMAIAADMGKNAEKDSKQ